MLVRASGPQAAVRELLGESALWWRCCGEAVRDDPAWLAGRGAEELRDWLAANAPDQEHAAAMRADHPLLLARALAPLDGGDEERDDTLRRLLGAWKSSGLLCSEAVFGPAQPSGHGLAKLSPRLAGGIDALLQRSQQLYHSTAPGAPSPAAEGLLVVATLMMAGIEPRKRPVVRVPVVFGRSPGQNGEIPAAEGATGVLELREFRPGPAGLYPDPRTMDGVNSRNAQFASALGTAWRLTGAQAKNRCVVWRIILSDEPSPPERIEGPSLGAAFALGLRTLLRRQPGAGRVRDVFYGLRPRTVVTGALDADGYLLRVAGMDAKLLAARRKGFRLVAPEPNRLEVSATAPRPGDVRFAATLRDADRYARQFRTGRIAVTALVLAAVTTGAFALHQSGLAETRRQSALISQVTARAEQLRTTDPSLAARADIEAYRLNPTGDRFVQLINDANKPLPTVLNDFSYSVKKVAFSPDGHTLAAAGHDDAKDTGVVRFWDMTNSARPVLLGEPLRVPGAAWMVFSPDGDTLATSSGPVPGNEGVRLWDVTDPSRPHALGAPLPHTTGGSPLAFSPDGRTLATGTDTYAEEQLWDVQDVARPVPLGQPFKHASAVNVVTFSPDSRSLVTSSVNDGARMWNVTDPTRPVLHGKIWAALGVAMFTPDGRTLAIADGGTVHLLNVTDPKHVTALGNPVTSYRDGPSAMALSANGHTLAAPDGEQSLRLWNISDPAHPKPIAPPLAGHSTTALSFAPDGRTVATTSGDRAVHLWHLPTALLTGHTEVVGSTVAAPNGRVLASASNDNTVRLWDTTNSARPTPLSLIQNFSGTVISLAFSPDSRILATVANGEKRVILWNLEEPTKPALLAQISVSASAGVVSVGFSPDGQTLATATATGIVGGENSVKLWDVSHPSQPRLRGKPITPDSDKASNWAQASLIFSADGHTLVIAGRYTSNTVQLWDVTDPDHPVRSGPPIAGGARWMALSPDGNTLATVSSTGISGSPGDGDVKLWDISDRNHPTRLGPPLSGYTSRVTDLAFSPDGQTLATSGDGVRLWDVTDPGHPAAIGQPLAISTAELTSLAYLPNTQTLATGGQDNTVRLWPLAVEQSVGQICANTDAPTRPQWKRYLSMLPYHSSCDRRP
ncbi:WD40 repeat domain-containing protein [Streptomyces sp. OM5714]|uniref:WD40 repeat domain-containing protein n=1 Tax=Streptomyces sp. OM5714 TaxID=2602736 RepID=UPI0013DBDC13|nr:WD40 repeat domain-containing protein [Streptomyces sp. OM5714]